MLSSSTSDTFLSYLNLGFHHIADINGLDHILFIITLCACYSYPQWRKVTIMITAFTIGHSITLALAALKIIVPNSYLIELLIPFTILISGIYNLIGINQSSGQQLAIKYALALIFGLVHGMAFSNYFNFMMGSNALITFPLFAFNVGIEAGQLFIISLYYILAYLLTRRFQITYHKLTLSFSVLGICIAVFLIFTRI